MGTLASQMATPTLDSHNNLVYNAVLYALTTEPHKHRAKDDALFADFGAANWCIQYVDGAEFPDVMRVSLKMPGLDKQVGVAAILEDRYSDVLVSALAGFDVTIEFNIDSPPGPAEEFALKVALLARTAAGATLFHHFKELEAAGDKGKMAASEPVKVMSRPGEFYWVINSTDKVIIAYSLSFLDEESRVIAGLCINQGFSNTEKYASSAPTVSWQDAPPAEIAGCEGANSEVGWSISTFFARHVAGPKMNNAVAQAVNWRNTLAFHIKAAKQFTTSKMRHRVEFFQKVLDRAVPKKAQGKSTKGTLAAVSVAGKLLGKARAKGAAGEV